MAHIIPLTHFNEPIYSGVPAMPVWLSAIETKYMAVKLFAISFSANPEVLEGVNRKKDAASIPHARVLPTSLLRNVNHNLI